MFGLFKKKKTPSMVVATLNARLQPLDRGDVEDAFDAAMAKHGMRVVGGGTQMAQNGEIEFCDIEIEVDDLSEKSLETLTGVLETMVAPKGSTLRVDGRDEPIPFGKHEGLALYLNGTDLAAEIYSTCDVNHVYSECNRLLEGLGHVASHWQGATESALYMYGQDHAAMHDRLTPFLASYPLCQKSRVEQIA